MRVRLQRRQGQIVKGRCNEVTSTLCNFCSAQIVYGGVRMLHPNLVLVV